MGAIRSDLVTIIISRSFGTDYSFATSSSPPPPPPLALSSVSASMEHAAVKSQFISIIYGLKLQLEML